MENGVKMILMDVKVLLNVIFYDLEFVVILFVGMIVIFGLNVMVYVVEVFYVDNCMFEIMNLVI